MILICKNEGCQKDFQTHDRNRKFCCLRCCWDWRKKQEHLPGTFKKGQVSPNKGKPMSEETKSKVSMSKKGRPNLKLRGRIFTPEWKEKLKTAHSNRSEEWRKRISDANKGRPSPLKGISRPETTGEKNPFYGKHHTQESKDKVSRAKTGVKNPLITGKNHPMWKYPESFKNGGNGNGGFREDLGIYLRSNWEANILRIFNHLGLHVEYEPKHFRLPDGSTYTPDFYVHETDEFIEVKGYYSDQDKQKVKLFRLCYPALSYSMIFEKEYKHYLKEFANCGLQLEGVN